MMDMNSLLLVDFYKVHHYKMYPKQMSLLYSNFTPRKSRMPSINKVVVFGIQYAIKEYLIDHFNRNFFLNPIREFGINHNYVQAKKKIMFEHYKRITGITDIQHISDLWDLGYLPIKIKALPEGSRSNMKVPIFTIRSTKKGYGWLVNYLETLLSTILWQMMTSITITDHYVNTIIPYVMTTMNCSREVAFSYVQWMIHDFSMRGLSSVESGITSGMAHLASGVTGTDTVPAIVALEHYYKATGLVGASVPATEHSVMCMGTKEDEVGTFERLLDLYPTGILSVVSDTWNLWDVVRPGGICTKLKDKIMARDGKLVIRPDSGIPADIICGLPVLEDLSEVMDVKGKFIYGDGVYTFDKEGWQYYLEEYGEGAQDYKEQFLEVAEATEEEKKGVIQLLWEGFGGTTVIGSDGNEYRVLDSHIGAIYGDSITPPVAIEIMERLKANRFASVNIVFGVGLT